MKKIFKNGWIREQEEILLTQFEWEVIGKKYLNMIPFENDEKYKWRNAVKMMKGFAELVFRNECFEKGFRYYDVKDVFWEQNSLFITMIRENLINNEKTKFQGDFLKKMCKSLIVPKRSRVEWLIEEIKKLTPEEQAEALQLFANKKIKITVEDI